jgi:hypothetical protein
MHSEQALLPAQTNVKYPEKEPARSARRLIMGGQKAVSCKAATLVTSITTKAQHSNASCLPGALRQCYEFLEDRRSRFAAPVTTSCGWY